MGRIWSSVWLAVEILFILGSGIGIGWAGSKIWEEIINHRDFDGLHTKTNSHDSAIQIAQKYDSYGDWICINTKGMSYKECVITAQHECGHEVFAEIIEKHPEKIESVMEVIKK